MSAEKWLLAWFLSLIVVGALVLSLPMMSHAGGISLIDALFTSATAVCVTGLMVVDVHTDLTLAGRIVVLVLIQCGGVGIVTFASVLILSAQSRLPLGYESIVNTTVSPARSATVRHVLRTVLITTLVIEAAAVAVLFVVWPSDGPGGFAAWPERLWAAAFHAVSAFCNAGITLFSDSLAALRGEPAVLLVIMMLIVLGGFGFINLYELIQRARTRTMRWSRFSLFLKATIVATLGINVAAAVTIGLLEAGVGFANLTPGETFLAAIFHAISTRTAGFSTVAIDGFTEVSLVLIMALMFIGASSGSCGGGVKVGTIVVLFAVVRGHIRHDTEPVLFNRRLTRLDQRKAFVLVVASLLLFLVAVLTLYMVESGLKPLTAAGTSLLQLGFETMSALGTVGLSTGVTTSLSPTGKAIVIVLMIVGRLGPLAVIAAWTKRPTPRPFTSPEESLPIG